MKERKELLKKYDKKFWLIPLGVFLIPILFEFAYRDPLFDASVKLIVKIQDKLGNLEFVQKYSFLFHSRYHSPSLFHSPFLFPFLFLFLFFS